MTENTMPSPADIRAFRAENPKMRERDIAAQPGVSRQPSLRPKSAFCHPHRRQRPEASGARRRTSAKPLALSRNESAVHEKIGVYENIKTGGQGAIVLGENIDLRIFEPLFTPSRSPRRTAIRSA